MPPRFAATSASPVAAVLADRELLPWSEGVLSWLLDGVLITAGSGGALTDAGLAFDASLMSRSVRTHFWGAPFVIPGGPVVVGRGFVTAWVCPTLGADVGGLPSASVRKQMGTCFLLVHVLHTKQEEKHLYACVACKKGARSRKRKMHAQSYIIFSYTVYLVVCTQSLNMQSLSAGVIHDLVTVRRCEKDMHNQSVSTTVTSHGLHNFS